MKQRKRIVVKHHLGIGDHFICNGLIHKLLETNDIDLICKRIYEKTVRHLYEDVTDKLNVIPIDVEDKDELDYVEKTKLDYLKVGFVGVDFSNFEESFYKQLNFDPELEYSNFKLPRNLSSSKLLFHKYMNKFALRPYNFEYNFVHDQSSTHQYNLMYGDGSPVDLSPYLNFYVEKEDTDDILDYIDLILNAREVHVINSGLNNLVFQLIYKDMLDRKKVYFHKARKYHENGIPVKIPQGVKVIEYE